MRLCLQFPSCCNSLHASIYLPSYRFCSDRRRKSEIPPKVPRPQSIFRRYLNKSTHIPNGKRPEQADRLLGLVTEIAGELLGAGDEPPPVLLDTPLEHGAGLDSLGRAELFVRVERAFGVCLPNRLLAAARTSRDLLPWLDPENPPTVEPLLPDATPSPAEKYPFAQGEPALPNRARAGMVATVYAAYAWLVFGLVAPIFWLLVLLPSPFRFRWGCAHYGARVLARACGTPVRVASCPPKEGPYILVANHASYIDPVALCTALPSPVRFVAKAELTGQLLTRIPLARIRVTFVERFNVVQGLADARRLSEEASAGPPLLFFPEGTFYSEAGLLPFRMGAFVAAANAHVPVVPVVIQGARRTLRANSWFPTKGPLSVTFLPPVQPREKGWHGAIDLKNRVRQSLLAHLDEPDRGALRTPVSSR